MTFVHLPSGYGDYWVVPEHVAWLQVFGDDETKIGFVGASEPIIVDGTPDDVGVKLQPGS
jgi:hypothetical protein